MTFTNVAADQIHHALRDYMGLEVSYPHFLGTIDSFIDKHVFIPHAHRLIGQKSSGRVRLLTGESGWARSAYPEWSIAQQGSSPAKTGSRRKPGALLYNAVDCHRLPDGTCVFTAPKFGQQAECRMCASRQNRAPVGDRFRLCGKLKMAFDGYATHDDAMFWALEILRRWKDVLDHLATRFSVILVDELQDTKPTQLEALKLLRDTRRCRFFVAFDPDQAIYEYSHALPANCASFTQQFKDLRVTGTYRSTQEICDAVHPFSTLPIPSASRAAHRGMKDTCLMLTYDDPNQAVLGFVKLVKDRGLDPKQCAILVRKRDSVEEVQSVSKPSSLKGAGALTKALMGVYTRMEDGNYSDAHERLRDALVSQALVQDPHVHDYVKRRELKRGLNGRCGEAIHGLPEATLRFIDWQKEMRRLLTGLFPEISNTEASVSCLLRRPSGFDPSLPTSGLLTHNHLATGSPSIQVNTVHGVKGKNLQGVMLLTMMKKKYDRQWLDDPRGSDGFWPEETRIAYVAMTRAEKLLVLAIPNKAPSAVLAHARLAGFVRIT